MCGLVCAVGSPQPEVVRALAARAAERGPHSYGWGFGRPTGAGTSVPGWEWRFDRGSGPLPAPTRAMTEVVIGHSRLATTGSRPGDAPPSAEAQPVCIGGWVVAHNGDVPDIGALTDREVTIDTEAIALALDRGMPLDDVISALAGTPQALVVSSGPVTWAIRVPGKRRPAHPLWRVDIDGTVYLCSRPMRGGVELPEGVTRVE